MKHSYTVLLCLMVAVIVIGIVWRPSAYEGLDDSMNQDHASDQEGEPHHVSPHDCSPHSNEKDCGKDDHCNWDGNKCVNKVAHAEHSGHEDDDLDHHTQGHSDQEHADHGEPIPSNEPAPHDATETFANWVA